MGMDPALRLRTKADAGADTALRQTIAPYTASFKCVCGVGWEMTRLNGVELHHQI